MKRAALYIRVSTEEQARHGYSIAEQEHDLTEYARANGYAVVDVYADEGVSARKAMSRRHALQRLLADVEAGKIDVIVVKCLDRFFRNVRDFYKVQERLDAHGVEWTCTQEDFNTTTANGRLLLNLKLSLAQHESDQTSERLKYVFEGMKRKKIPLTGVMPYGYKIERANGRRCIVLDPDTAPNVEQIFAFFLRERSIGKTCQFANKLYGRNWWKSSIRAILSNPTYKGERHGIAEYCPAIIPLETFERVQSILKSRATIFDRSKNTGNVYIFTGLIYCPLCGSRMYGGLQVYANGNRALKYSCRMHYNEFRCDYTKTVFQSTLEKWLLANVQRLVCEYITGARAAVAKKRNESPTDTIKETRGKLARLSRVFVDGLISSEEYEREKAELETALSSALVSSHRTPAPPSIEKFQAVLDSGFHAVYDTLTPEGKRTFWHGIIEHIEPQRDAAKGKGGIKYYTVRFQE